MLGFGVPQDAGTRKGAAMKLKGILCTGTVRTIHDAVEAWKKDHAQAMVARDTEELVDLYLKAGVWIREWYDEAWKLLLAGQLPNTQEVGGAIQRCLRGLVDAAPPLAEGVCSNEKRGFVIEGSAKLPAAIEAGEAMLADLERRWPFLDPQEVEASRARIARGEFRTGEEILRELQGSD